MPAQIQRSSVVRGPGTVSLGGVQIFDRENIRADINVATFDVPVSAYGNVDSRRQDITGAVGFRPCGRLTNNILSALFPHGTPNIGASLFGASDTACEIHSTAGTKVTFHAAALTQMPNLKLSTTATAFESDAEIMALIKNNTARITANSLYTVASTPWSGAFDTADIKGGSYQGTWNGTTFQTADGWSVEFDMETEEQYLDGLGTYDVILKDVRARAKCQPIGLDEDTLLGNMNLQGADAVMGGSMRSGHDLVITASGALTVTLHECDVREGPLEWGDTTLRAGEIGFEAHRTLSGGVPSTLFSVSL